MQNQIGPGAKARTIIRSVVHSGTQTIRRGMALCYKRDIGTAADADGRRGNYVELPSATNFGAFAGVAMSDFVPGSGNAPTIDIAEPGSVVALRSIVATTVNSGLLTFMAQAGGSGYFMEGAFRGRGSAIPLQTVTAPTKEDNLVGSGSVNATVLTDAAATFVTNGVQAGDTVLIFGTGLTTGTPGSYTVSSVDSETQITLTASASTAAQDCAYAIPGSLVLALLLDGEESFGAELLMPRTGAITCLPGGYTLFTGRPTAPAADATIAFSPSALLVPYGARKRFKLNATVTTNDVMVNFATNGLQINHSTALASLEFDAANDESILRSNGAIWILELNSGPTIA